MHDTLIQRTYKITEMDDAGLRALATDTGSLSKSAEIRRLVREELARRGLVVELAEAREEVA